MQGAYEILEDFSVFLPLSTTLYQKISQTLYGSHTIITGRQEWSYKWRPTKAGVCAQCHTTNQRWEVKSYPHLLYALSPVYCFTFLLCVFGPKANNLWHKLSLDTLKNVDTSNREKSVGKKLNLKPKLIEVSQNLTLLEESLLWLSIYSTKKVQCNTF